MTLDKAIEILKEDLVMLFEGDTDDLHDARQLGIEALKREQSNRGYCLSNPKRLLPGETE